MISKGHMINDRYEIFKNIGEGGMANVYLAHDTILDRDVAVKILRGDLADDEKFVRRFQREAISASSLSHPNIVEVYDVGEDNGKYFIVMEYVNGKTLKSLIKKRGALTLPEVQDIMLQLTSAIAHAHESYIIHRDIKPQNVMIMEDGRVKITDFGIAMALNSNELTQTNSVMGSVHYLPPEQANGEPSTVKSDIYSLGILMYELVMGKVPFKGDSAVEIAIKQMKEKLPEICEDNPEVPQSMENIILRAAAKNPKNRYDSVSQMHSDLVTVLDDDRFDEPKIRYEYPENEVDERPTRQKRNSEEPKEDKKINKALTITSIICGILILALVFVFIIYPKLGSTKQVTIPDVSDMTVAEATTQLEDKGFKVSDQTKEETNEDIEKGKVSATDPEAHTKVDEGSTITLILSSGTDKITLEDYTGQDFDTVKAELEELGLIVKSVKEDVPETKNYSDNQIISQDLESGKEVEKETTITFTLPNIYSVYPDFVKEDYSVESVQTFCDKNNIDLNVKYVVDDDNVDVVLSQNKKAGSKISAGTTLTITVGKKSTTQSSTNTTNTTNTTD